MKTRPKFKAFPQDQDSRANTDQSSPIWKTVPAGHRSPSSQNTGTPTRKSRSPALVLVVGYTFVQKTRHHLIRSRPRCGCLEQSAKSCCQRKHRFGLVVLLSDQQRTHRDGHRWRHVAFDGRIVDLGPDAQPQRQHQTDRRADISSLIVNQAHLRSIDTQI